MKNLFFNANGIRLNYVEGPDNGPAIVLIRAQSATWESYTPVFKYLNTYFHVFCLSIRGHGKSDWVPGTYNFNTIGNDLVYFLERVVKQPALLVGNSSGGLISLWTGINYPDLVKGIVLEDAPLFSADWPRIKQEYVFDVLSKTVYHLDRKQPDYEGLFRAMVRPLPNGKSKNLPKWLCKVLGYLITHQNNLCVTALIGIFPKKIKRLVNDLPTFDPGFSKAWIDGTMYQGLNHEKALRDIRLPLLILHADWYRIKEQLIGAMDDNDARKALLLAPHAKYIRIHTGHGIHSERPQEFAEIITTFVHELPPDNSNMRYNGSDLKKNTI